MDGYGVVFALLFVAVVAVILVIWRAGAVAVDHKKAEMALRAAAANCSAWTVNAVRGLLNSFAKRK